jgi:predicted outer membrane protein
MRRCILRKSFVVAVAILGVGFTSRTFSQQNDPAARPDDRASSADRAGQPDQLGQKGQHIDQMVANQAFEMSKGEIDLANFALKRTQNEEVRRFAQMMIEDHTNLNNQLAKFASPELTRNASNESNPSQQGATPGRAGTTAAPGGATEQPGSTTARNPADRGTESATGGNPHVQICEDIGAEIGSKIEKELGQYQGSDFDRAYTGQQFWGHVTFVGFARGAEKHVSKDLQQVLDQGATTAEKHLEHCRTLIRNLSANVARGNNETAPRR